MTPDLLARGLVRPCVLINDRNQYAQVNKFNRSFKMHRAVYQFVFGVIPHHYDVDHLCSQKACIEITHLEAVPKSENVRRSWARGERRKRSNQYNDRTHCKYGHEYTAENTKITSQNGRPVRWCRECLKRRKRDSYARLHPRST